MAETFDLKYVQMCVSSHMESITKLFKRGVKIAVLVRSPGFPDRDFMMTDDAIPELRAMLARREGRKPCGECHLQPNETCDICGARENAEPAFRSATAPAAEVSDGEKQDG